MYVGSKLQENMINIQYPVSGCRGFLEANDFHVILQAEVFNRWGKASCEAVIAESEKFYCPFRDCSTLLINNRMEAVRESKCPSCKRMFCVQCRVPWHKGIECGEFQKLKEGEREEEDVMLMRLDKKMKWKRWPYCGRCSHIITQLQLLLRGINHRFTSSASSPALHHSSPSLLFTSSSFGFLQNLIFPP